MNSAYSGPEILNRSAEVPLHRQLRQILLNRIESGEWPVGTVIPREIDLMAEFGLSRHTVRQALDDLAQGGLLVRTKKRGTMVSQPKVEQSLTHFYSFARDMAARGYNPTSRILELAEIDPEAETTRKLAGWPTKVWHLRRLRMADGLPLLIESTFLALPPNTDLHGYNWQVLALYEVLANDFGIRVEKAEEFLEPVVLKGEEARLLEVPENTPAFRVERLSYDSEGKVFERRLSLIRGDRYRFHIELPGLELGN